MNAIGSTALIRDAVNGEMADHALARSNRRFTQTFDRLVYNQIWEDPAVDMAAMELRPHHRVVTICSAGCNALSYLLENPAAIFAVDLNAAHLALAEVKRAAFDVFDSAGPVRLLFVEGQGSGNGAMVRERLIPRLSAAAQRYWQSGFSPKLMAFERGLFQRGLLGHAVGLARTLARVHSVNLEDILALDDAAAQRDWVRRHIRPIFESRFASVLFSLRHPLFLLGIPPRQFQLLCDGDPARMPDVLSGRIEQLAGVAKSSENYFLWQGFARKYAPGPDADVPPYLKTENFEIIKARVARLTLHHANMTDHLAERRSASLDRFVLLDAQDWMDQGALTALWAEMTRTARPGARVIFRTAGRLPPFLAHGNDGEWRRWERLNDLSDSLHLRDRSGIYGGFHVYHLAA